jgi:hypothetical protein
MRTGPSVARDADLENWEADFEARLEAEWAKAKGE